MKKIKVLNIYNELRYSGAEIRILNGYDIWQKEGIINDILSTGEDGIGDFAGEFEKLNFKVFHIPFTKSPFFFVKVWKLIEKHNYDIVHVFPERVNLFYIITIWLAGKKIVRSICNNFVFGKSMNFRKMVERKIVQRLNCQQIAVSRSVNQNEKKSFKNPTRVIENWFNDKKYFLKEPKEYSGLRVQLNISQESFVLISVGNCNHTKNHNLIIKSLPLLKSRISNFTYIHIGEEHADHPEREFARELGVEENILFLGYQSSIRKYLVVSDVFLLPSFFEGFPNAPIEALSVGTPVILTDVPGSRDLRGLPATYFMDAMNEHSLVNELVKVYELSFDERIKIGKDASKAVNKNYKTQRGILEFVELYRSLCD